jgi:hypothetical protein
MAPQFQEFLAGRCVPEAYWLDVVAGNEVAVVGEARLVILRDAGVVQPAQDLRLVGDALHQSGGNEAGADDLEGDEAAGAILLGLPSDRPILRAGQGTLQHALVVAPLSEVHVAGQQVFHLGAEAGIARAGGLQEGRTPFRG